MPRTHNTQKRQDDKMGEGYIPIRHGFLQVLLKNQALSGI